MNLGDGQQPTCSCPDFEKRGERCKHIFAVEFTLKREEKPDGTTVVTKTMRVTYKQEWPAYNAAQTHEQERFTELLRDLCAGIEAPPYQGNGRPPLPLSDVVFALAYKVYSTMSGRRFASDLREAEATGFVTKAASYNSAFRYLENPALTPLLKDLIDQTARPLKAVETDFAVDSSGFATSVYARWFDHKWGKERTRQTWVKTHLMVGVKTHIVTSVEATPYESADTTQFAPLVAQTAQTFAIRKVSADKGYSSRANLRAVAAVGGRAFIPFKSNSTGMASSHHGFDGLWTKMFAYYTFNRDAFLSEYHQRSNVESTFSMIKAKFGGSVRSKLPDAQVNEVLCKVLCHNICCLIQSIYEFGLEPMFWTSEAKGVVAPKVTLFPGL